MNYVYLLKLADESIYTGSTNDVKKRVEKHNKGDVLATKGKRPIKLEIIYREEFNIRELAEKAERYYKSGAGRIKLKKFLSIYSEYI